jgi:hypothetical protein
VLGNKCYLCYPGHQADENGECKIDFCARGCWGCSGGKCIGCAPGYWPDDLTGENCQNSQLETINKIPNCYTHITGFGLKCWMCNDGYSVSPDDTMCEKLDIEFNKPLF